MFLLLIIILVIIMFLFKQTDKVGNIFKNYWKNATTWWDNSKTGLKRMNYSDFIDFYKYAWFYDNAINSATKTDNDNIVERYTNWLNDNNYIYSIAKTKDGLNIVSNIIKKDNGIVIKKDYKFCFL